LDSIRFLLISKKKRVGFSSFLYRGGGVGVVLLLLWLCMLFFELHDYSS
jgi:hypothetical protein